MRSTERSPLSRAVAAVCAVVLTAGVVACGAQQPAGPEANTYEEQPAGVDPWAALRFSGALEAEPRRPIAELGSSADVVAIGTFTDTLAVRTVGDGQGAAYVLPVSFVPSRVLKGDAEAPLVVEFLLLVGRADEIMTGVEAYRRALLETEMLLLLRAKRGQGEEGLYRIVNSYGLWVATDRHDLDAPLAEEDPWKNDEFRATLTDAQGSLSTLATIAASSPHPPDIGQEPVG